MKITDERKEEKVKFDTLSRGNVFIYDGCVYMKTHRYQRPIHPELGDINAISLEDGDDIFLTYKDFVEPLDAELIIRG